MQYFLVISMTDIIDDEAFRMYWLLRLRIDAVDVASHKINISMMFSRCHYADDADAALFSPPMYDYVAAEFADEFRLSMPIDFRREISVNIDDFDFFVVIFGQLLWFFSADADDDDEPFRLMMMP